MTVTVLIFIATCVVMICGILFFPHIRIFKKKIDTYWIIALAGAVIMLASGQADGGAIWRALTADTAVNPVKILILFISMTVISVFLDELGFFSYLANAVLKRAKTSQFKLFVYLYIVVSVLTVFTSNDVIILSFTPFICYFAKHAKINPVPYLAAEFVAANTWSMALIIGNPTNIYLATAYGLDFAGYVKISVIPTLFAGVAAFVALYLMFRKKLAASMEGEAEEVAIQDKFLTYVGIMHLVVCTVLLAIGSYIGIEMWLVALCAAVSLFLFALVTAAVRKKKPSVLKGCIVRAPWQLVPFVLSMFVLVAAMEQKGVSEVIAGILGGNLSVVKYGVASFLASNVMNNIPMSVLFYSVIASVSGNGVDVMFATVIGSNLGTFFTPVGALAGIMWSTILHRHGLKFGYKDFLKIGFCIAVPALFAAICGLYLVGAIGLI